MIIFLHGPDTFRSRRKLAEIISKFKAQVDPSGLNVNKLAGEKLEVPALQEALTASPFMAKKRLVIVEELIGKNRGKKIHQEVGELLSAKAGDTIVVFWEQDVSTKKTNSLRKRLAGEKLAQEFQLLAEHEVRRFITVEVANRGGNIDTAAAQLLARLIGNNLWQAHNEIDKLLAAAKDRAISSTDVHLLTESTREDDIFKLTDALAQQQTALALGLIRDQLSLGTTPVELLSKIIWQFKTLLLVKSFTETNGEAYDSGRIAAQLKLHPFVVKKALAAGKRHSGAQLKTMYEHLIILDRRFKTSQADAHALLDVFTVTSSNQATF